MHANTELGSRSTPRRPSIVGEGDGAMRTAASSNVRLGRGVAGGLQARWEGAIDAWIAKLEPKAPLR